MTSISYIAWVIKYKPKSLIEVVGNKDAIKKLSEWVKSWEIKKPSKKSVLLFGPPGIGKTVSVEVLAKDFQLELVEKNASDYRTESMIKRFAGLATQYRSLFYKRRIVLLDELEGVTGHTDKGGIKAILEIIKSTHFPLVLIANDAYLPKLSSLRRYCLLIQFRKPTANAVLKHLKRICNLENIVFDENALKFLAQRSAGDIRSAVHDLQALAQGKSQLVFDDVSWLGYRDKKESIFNVMKLILYGQTCLGAKQAVRMSNVDFNMLFEWIYENVPFHLTDPHDLVNALDSLSLADIYRGRINSTQNWGLTRYVLDFMAAGVAMAREKTKTRGWIPFRFPERIKMLSSSRLERSILLKTASKIGDKSHTSISKASQDILPYLKVIFENNKQMAVDLSRWFNFDPSMIKYLTEDENQAKEIIEMLN